MQRSIAILLFWSALAVSALPAAAQQSTRGYVPRHRLIQQAREQAKRDWERGRVRPQGSERQVRMVSHVGSGAAPTGSGVRQTAYNSPGLPPYHEPAITEGMIINEDGGFHSDFAGDCGSCGGCGGSGPVSGFCGPNGCGGPDHSCNCGVSPCCCLPRLQCATFEAFFGTQGFTGPMNLGGTGSFGFHEGINFSSKLFREWGGQIGVRGVHSNFSGTSITTESRNQVFFTAGVFRRADCGLQAGIVFDHLSDDWFVDADLSQARGEASWVMQGTSELGFHFRTDLNKSNIIVNNNTIPVQTTEVFALFYRHRFLPCGAGEGRLYAGFSGNRDGLIGGDFRMPMTHTLSIDGGWTYLIPDQATNQGGALNEAWNIFLGVAWQPGAKRSSARNYYRPLFRVADNGTLFADF